MAKSLSPAAQAVLDAAVLPCTIRQGIAAAIRALVEQTVPDPDPGARLHRDRDLRQWEIRCIQLAIAAELEGGATPTTPREAQ